MFVPVKPNNQKRVCVRMHDNMIRELIRWCCRCYCPSIVYTCSSPTGARRSCCHHIVYIWSSPLVLSDAAATTCFTAAPLPLVLTDAAADIALHSLLCPFCSCSPIHRCTLSPTQAHTVFGQSRIWEIASRKWILYIQNFVVLQKCTVCFTRRHFSYRESTCEITVHFFVLFVVIAK